MPKDIFWMAPEMVNTKKGSYGFGMDIWSLGCVIYKMWAGGVGPWAGEEMVGIMFKVCQSARLATYYPEFPL